MAFIFFSIFAERGELLLTHPTLVLKVLPAAALLLLACLLSGLLLSSLWGLSLATTEAVMITATTKNTFIGLAIAASAFSNYEAIIIAICGPITQLPFMLLYVTVAGLFCRRDTASI